MTTGPENPYGEQQPPQPNPYYPQQQPPPPPYSAPQPDHQQGYQQPGQPGYQQPGYPQQGYPQPGQPPYGYGYTPPPPTHPSANTSMVLGIIGLAGIALCGGITLVLSPFAWVIGAKASREIKASPGTYGGESAASAGKIMGIIGTILLILGVLAFAAFIAWAVSYDTTLLEDTSSS